MICEVSFDRQPPVANHDHSNISNSLLTHEAGVQGGGQCCSPHPLPLSLGLRPVSGAQTHRPVNQVKHQEHDREHNEKHVIHFGSGNKNS